MTVPETLVEKIEATRITYPEREHGFTIRGSPFICEFETPVDPQAFAETITTADDPWRLFGVPMQISDEYWKVKAVLFHVDDGETIDASEISLEIAPEWMRVYVKEECSAERAADFIRALDAEYGINVEFVEKEDSHTSQDSQ